MFLSSSFFLIGFYRYEVAVSHSDNIDMSCKSSLTQPPAPRHCLQRGEALALPSGKHLEKVRGHLREEVEAWLYKRVVKRSFALLHTLMISAMRNAPTKAERYLTSPWERAVCTEMSEEFPFPLAGF